MKNNVASSFKDFNSNYLIEYNELISKAALEFNCDEAAIASPTLSKQETITHLYKRVNGESNLDHLFSLRFALLRAFQFIPRLVLMFLKIVYLSVKHRVKTIPEGAVYFRTWLVPRSFFKNILVDDYFRVLPADLRACEKVVVGYSALYFDLTRKFSSCQKEENCIVSYGFLGINDILKLFYEYICAACIRTKKEYFLNGKNISKDINRSLLMDYLMLRSFGAYVEKYICLKLIAFKIKAFVYVFENQSWEKMCCLTLRGHDIRIIGYQSSGFSPIFLNFFPTKTDMYHHPMPDIILTVGELFTKYLVSHGSYNIQVETFSALRFSYRCEQGDYIVMPPNLKIIGRVLYAFPVQMDQYERIIGDLISIFGGSQIEVDLKFHPLHHLDGIMGIHVLPKNFKVISHLDMSALKDEYDCILFNDNSFGIEAILNGVKAYQYSHDLKFEDNRFIYFDLWKVDYQIKDLLTLKNQLENRVYKKDYDVDGVSTYINRMYRPYSKECFERFCELINYNSLNFLNS